MGFLGIFESQSNSKSNQKRTVMGIEQDLIQRLEEVVEEFAEDAEEEEQILEEVEAGNVQPNRFKQDLTDFQIIIQDDIGSKIEECREEVQLLENKVESEREKNFVKELASAVKTLINAKNEMEKEVKKAEAHEQKGDMSEQKIAAQLEKDEIEDIGPMLNAVRGTIKESKEYLEKKRKMN